MTAKDLINDPGFLAYRFDFNTENIGFIAVSREEVRRVSSLRRENIDPARELVEVPLAEVIEPANFSRPSLTENPPRFIFHTAFCASTFLSRCLDVEDVCITLREPQLLLDAANAKRLQWRSQKTSLDYRNFPELALALLRKHATASEKLIVKPINSVNNIISELLEATGSSKSLLLYTDARNFVLSTLGKGEGGKQTIRSMFDLLRCDFPHLANLQLTHALHMTDLRIIMTLWRLQLEQAEATVREVTPGNAIATLYGEKIIASPQAVLPAVNRFLELGLSFDQIDAIANSDERFNDAKNEGETFSKRKREERYERLEEFYGADLDDGLQWLLRNNPGSELYPNLSTALQI